MRALTTNITVHHTPPMKWLNTLLDRTVVFNFDRTGYERHARQFNDADLDAI